MTTVLLLVRNAMSSLTVVGMIVVLNRRLANMLLHDRGGHLSCVGGISVLQCSV